MIVRSLAPVRRFVAASLVLGVAGAPQAGVAQQEAPRPSAPPTATPATPPNPDVVPVAPPATPPTPPAPLSPSVPSNPLVLPTTPATTAPALAAPLAAQGDYRHGVVGSGAKSVKILRSFGYDFFAPARQIIEARRAFLQRRYGGSVSATSQTTNPAAPAATPADPPAGSAEKRGADPLTAPALPPPTTPTTPTPTTPTPTTPTTPATPPTTNEPAAEREGMPERAGSTDAAGPVDAFREVADPLTQLYSNASASVPPTYQLAPGDALLLRYGSATRAAREIACTVDSAGAIMLEQVGRIVVRGLTVAQAERALRQRLGRLYKRPEVSVTLREMRTIAITVAGEAFAPGTYVVPAVATAFNVLYAAGGPTEDGSLRRIEVRRRGAPVGTLDLYQFLSRGDQAAADLPLQAGDVLYLPPRLSRVVVDGEVRTPAVFELTDNETLRDALRCAGGVKPSGVDQRVQISTVIPGSARVLKDVDLRENNDGVSAANRLRLYDGDVVEVFSVRAVVMNRVTVEGAVDQPGDYAWTDGLRVSDLIGRARGVIGETHLGRADLFRWNPDDTRTLIPVDLQKALARDPAADVVLTRWDRLRVYARSEVAWTGRRETTVRGAVQRPGVYSRSDNMRLSDLLRMAGGPTPDAFLGRAVLLHRQGDGAFRYDFVSLNDLLKNAPDAADPVLEDDDVLAVYRTGEAQFTPEHTVSIRGEVVTPGAYPRAEGMRLSDLLALSGGFLPSAGARVVVAHARRLPSDPDIAQTISFQPGGVCAPHDDVLLQDGDVVTVQGVGGFRKNVGFVTVRGAVNNPGPVVLPGGAMRLSDAVRAAGGLRGEAYAEGAEFVRNPTLLATAGQRDLAKIISQINDLLNQNTFQREQALSDLERIKATGETASDPSPLAAITGGKAAPAAPNPAAGALAAQLGRRDLVSPPRTLSPDDLVPQGNIAVDLAAALKKPGGGDDLLLAEGDIITIPERPSTVQVVGAIFNPRGVLFKPDAGLEHYVAQAGGLTPDAFRERIVVIRAGGGLIPAGKARQLKPGDVIIVPTRVLAEKLGHGKNNGVDNVFRSLTNSAVVFKLATGLFGL